MKMPTILAMVAGFVPFGQAVCFNGDIALVRFWSEHTSDVSITFQSANSFATIF